MAGVNERDGWIVMGVEDDERGFWNAREEKRKQ